MLPRSSAFRWIGKGRTSSGPCSASGQRSRADRDRLLQVFENLIGNAVKFTPAGGRITVSAEQCGTDVVFHVSDTGPGIAPDLLPRLFDRFWQGQPRDGRGVGLGLSIAHEVVEAHGGHIWAESPPGGGSTFSFSIPTAPDAPPRR